MLNTIGCVRVWKISADAVKTQLIGQKNEQSDTIEKYPHLQIFNPLLIMLNRNL